MCLAIPMQIIDIEGSLARCRARGIERRVSLFMLQDQALEAGDYVMVHVGYAIQKVQEQAALSVWEAYDQLAGLEQNRRDDHA